MAGSLKRTLWRLEIPADVLAKLRDDEPFHQILALGRLVNSLRFLELAFLGFPAHEVPSSVRFRLSQWLRARLRSFPLWPPSRDRPAGMRQRITSFQFMAATLFEGFRLLQKMRKNFHDQPVWQKEVAPILKDRLFERLFADSLEPLRNGAVFHFFYDVMGPLLRRLPDEATTFLSSYGTQQGQLVYELSDRLALDLFIGDVGGAKAQVERAAVLMTRTRDLLIQVDGAAEALIGAYAKQHGFQLVRGPRPGAV